MPCGRVPQCWPDSPAWSFDSKRLAFTLRAPGTHARSVYAVGSDGRELIKLLDFSGTIEHLRSLPDGRLAMLAIKTQPRKSAQPRPARRLPAIWTPLRRNSESQFWRTVRCIGSRLRSVVYEYDWRADGKGFIGTAAPGDGDNNWWTAKLYAFPENGAGARVIYAPSDNRQQLAMPEGVAGWIHGRFHRRHHERLRFNGRRCYALRLDGGTAGQFDACDERFCDRDSPGDATATCRRSFWRATKTQFADLGAAGAFGFKIAPPRVVWSGEESFGDRAGGISTACPSGVTADAHESFTQAPEIEIGAIGHWRNLTSINAGLSMPARVQSVW